MDIKQIFENNRNWIIKQLQIDEDYFKKLGKGQSPEFLYIGCSDSRVSAEELMGWNLEKFLCTGILPIWFPILT